MVEAGYEKLQIQNLISMPSIGDVYNMNRGQLMVFLLSSTEIRINDEANFWDASTKDLRRHAMKVITTLSLKVAHSIEAVHSSEEYSPASKKGDPNFRGSC